MKGGQSCHQPPPETLHAPAGPMAKLLVPAWWRGAEGRTYNVAAVDSARVKHDGWGVGAWWEEGGTIPQPSIMDRCAYYADQSYCLSLSVSVSVSCLLSLVSLSLSLARALSLGCECGCCLPKPTAIQQRPQKPLPALKPWPCGQRWPRSASSPPPFPPRQRFPQPGEKPVWIDQGTC